MEKFCTNCGNPIEEGSLFCPECGQKVELSSEPLSTSFVAAAAATPAETPAAPASEYTFGMTPPAEDDLSASYSYSRPSYSYQPEPAPAAQPAQPPIQPVQPPVQPASTYAAPVPPQTFRQETAYGTVTNEPSVPVAKTSTFFWLALLFAIPVIGLIVMIVMAFTAKNDNVKHWIRSKLLWILIGLIVSIILGVIGYLIWNNQGIALEDIDYNAIMQSILDAIGK